MATVHLICGLPAAGKTTYSATLRDNTAGVHLSLDHWLVAAFGQYSIGAVGSDEHVRRVLACRELIWSVAEEFLHRNVDVILDDGFFFREHRVHYAAMAKARDVDIAVHFINTSRDTIESRLKKRNQALPPENFEIDPPMLEHFFDWFEVPSADEDLHVIEVRENQDNHEMQHIVASRAKC